MKNLRESVYQIIKDECDGTYNDSISEWSIASPEKAPAVLFEKLSGLNTTNVITKIQQWVIDRNLHTADPRIQMCKTVEEIGELANSLNKNNPEGAKDGIGDTVVTLICISQQLGLDFIDCLETAYNELKDRKGRMVNVVFVKEQDL